MNKGEPVDPITYALLYKSWKSNQVLTEKILTCTCKDCSVCKLIRPMYLAMVFPSELSSEGGEPDNYEDYEED